MRCNRFIGETLVCM